MFVILFQYEQNGSMPFLFLIIFVFYTVIITNSPEATNLILFTGNWLFIWG
jgi:hypothetical protein